MLISGLFVTYDDFVSYMTEHKEDFCYWILDSDYSSDVLISLNLPNTNLLAAMFLQQISIGTMWTSFEKVYDEDSDAWFDERKLISKGNDKIFTLFFHRNRIRDT